MGDRGGRGKCCEEEDGIIALCIVSGPRRVVDDSSLVDRSPPNMPPYNRLI